MDAAAEAASNLRARGLLAHAINPLRSPHDRRVAWDAFEVERDYFLVQWRGLHLRDLDTQERRDAVYRLIVNRHGCALLR